MLLATTPPSLPPADEGGPQSTLRDASHEPQNKRRKLARKARNDRHDFSIDQDAYLCIAKVDIQLVLFQELV